MSRKHSKTLVIGAGIFGASIAQALAKAGAPVTLIDQGAVDSVVTPRSFCWINVNRGAVKAYHLLR
jgi:glycine/D-amino acid oxidase-like deaminating enzyme